jgi:hypothetical protein
MKPDPIPDEDSSLRNRAVLGLWPIILLFCPRASLLIASLSLHTSDGSSRGNDQRISKRTTKMVVDNDKRSEPGAESVAQW